MTNVGDATKSQEAQSRNIMNICTKYDFFVVVMMDTDNTRHTTDDGQRQWYGMSSPV